MRKRTQIDLARVVEDEGFSARRSWKATRAVFEVMKEALLRGEPVETPAGILQVAKIQRSLRGRMRHLVLYRDQRNKPHYVMVQGRPERYFKFTPTVEFPDET